MKYFTLAELCASSTANANNIENIPNPEQTQNLMYLIEQVLDPVRKLWGGPIRVNSGYRCPALNAKVGGSKSSQHMSGQAVDITVGSRAENKKLFDLIVKSGIIYDQLIDESDYKWIHISHRLNSSRRQILHLS